ncbi:neuropeptide Y receptor type 2 [Pogona vitticeps]|uniref:Neuropeptide Y receptor type 2 n=1 Tax=Pogona vitticeps TaxID=103695 RepID=A0A6J0STS0_9SAUR|nr:neuropeptide Y receptor type 2 [Pogona vitticeps]XP_020637088.1 neuropeptide Y receptor type 2 [Pogona vitticeps]XP_020637089.1 neuropeptide Y receptor type 2 [Pogona vitticeps]
MGLMGGSKATGNWTSQAKMDLYSRLNVPGLSKPYSDLPIDPKGDLKDSTNLVEVQIVLICAYCAIILLGLVGNSLVIHVVIKFKSMRTVTNFFIANLAVADLLVNTLCLPFTLVYTLLGEWKLGPVLCHLVPYAQGLAVQVSIVTLTVIALDRHRCIVYHLESKISKRISFLIIGVAWAGSAILASPLAIFREYFSIELNHDFKMVVCAEAWPRESLVNYGTIYSVSMLLIQYVLPLVIISYAYIRIWSKLKHHVSPGAGNDHYHQRRRKTTKMLVCVVVVFAVCWLPFHIFQLVSDIDSKVLDLQEYKLIYTLFHVIAMCSTFANPLLYGWMNNNYRTAFLTAFQCEQQLDSIHPEVSPALKAKKNLEVKENSCNGLPFSQPTSV